MNSRIFPLVVLLAMGCPEPPTSYSGPGQGTQNGSAPGANAGDPGSVGEAPGTDGQIPQGSVRMAPEGFNVKSGEGVKVSGTILYEGEQEGVLHVDFLKSETEGAMPLLVHSLTLESSGPWEVEAPKSFGEISILAFLDANENGPSRGEPKVVTQEPIVIDSEAISGVELVIQDDWDIKHAQGSAGEPKEEAPIKGPEGELPPEGAPPEGAPPEGAPPVGAPPEGAPAPGPEAPAPDQG